MNHNFIFKCPRPSFILVVFILVISLYFSTGLVKRVLHVMASGRWEESSAPQLRQTVTQRWLQAQRLDLKKVSPKLSPWERVRRNVLDHGYDVTPEVFGPGSVMQINRVYTGLKYFLNSHLYRLVLRDFPFMPLSEQKEPPVLIERSVKPYLLPAPFCVTSSQEEAMKLQIEFFRVLHEKFPKLNIFIYEVQLAQFSHIYDEFLTGGKYQLSGEKLSEQFLSGLPPSIGYARFEYGLPQYREYFYRTDHHWTAKGAWAAYVQVLQMIRAKVPGIGDAVVPGRYFKVDGIRYRGAYAQTSAYADISDDLWDLEMDLPPYEVYFNDRIRLPRNDREAVLSGQYRAENDFENYYELYWGFIYGFIRYESAPGRRNLLLFADSFSLSMEAYFTAHYSNIYVIDSRVFSADVWKTFDLAGFMQSHPVDDVLFLLGSGGVLFEAEDRPFWNMLGEK